ncbi:MAG: FAD-dependent oxidoreductase [Halofilum sp. (in: g-proteobacteria)]
MTEHYDLLVIGGGSGGLATARRAAQHGARTAVVEFDRLGGTCVNRGCVPKKVMWYAASLAHGLGDAAEYGFDIDVRGHDWSALVEKRAAYIERLNGIYANNLDRTGSRTSAAAPALSIPIPWRLMTRATAPTGS